MTVFNIVGPEEEHLFPRIQSVCTFSVSAYTVQWPTVGLSKGYEHPASSSQAVCLFLFFTE